MQIAPVLGKDIAGLQNHVVVEHWPKTEEEAHALSAESRRIGARGQGDDQDTPIYVRRENSHLVEKVTLRELLHEIEHRRRSA